MSLNLASLVFESARRYPHQRALAGGDSYDDLTKKIEYFAICLKAQGVTRGDRVALMSENRPEFTVAYFAILSLGAIVVPINTLLSSREVVFCLEHAHVVGIVYSCAVTQKVAEGMAQVGHHLFQFSFDDFNNQVEIQNALVQNSLEPFPTAPDDTAVIFYTSGTTGQPKGAEVTHFNLYSNAQWVSERSLCNKTGVGEPWGPGHCTLAVLALSHSFGQTCMQNAPLLNGGCISYLSRFDAQELANQMAKDRVTILAAVPRMIQELLTLPQVPSELRKTFKYCLVGGAPIDPEVVHQFEARYGVSVLEGYGLSETSPVIVFRTPDIPRKKGSVGRAIRGVDIQVVDEAGRTLKAGQPGEIVVRGHAVMKGYYQNDAATQETIQNGWLHTGDVGYLDGDGDVFLIDRKKDVIIRNGYNVYPAEVEKVLCTFPGVLEAAVVGVEDARCGQEVKAFVVGQVDVDALKTYCKTQLAAYKYPRMIAVVKSLPKGSKGQVLRRVLRTGAI